MANDLLLAQELLKRKMIGGSDAKIGPTPEPTKARKLLEIVTGYPADPLAEMAPLNGIQMLASGLGIAGGLGKWAKVLKGTPSAKAGEIADDLYGINPTTTRRQFFDRTAGNPKARAVAKSTELMDKVYADIMTPVDVATSRKVGSEQSDFIRKIYKKFNVDPAGDDYDAAWRVRDYLNEPIPSSSIRIPHPDYDGNSKWISVTRKLGQNPNEAVETAKSNLLPSAIMKFIKSRFIQ